MHCAGWYYRATSSCRGNDTYYIALMCWMVAQHATNHCIMHCAGWYYRATNPHIVYEYKDAGSRSTKEQYYTVGDTITC
jgi:hypothetical protein